MFLFKTIFSLIFLIFIYSCNANKTDEEMKELWSKAQTTGAIIDRSGTQFNSGVDKQLALQDAETRLQTGGGLLKGGLKVDGILGGKEEKQASINMMGMPINNYLWRASLDTISFMPLNSADPIGGTILTDWYSTVDNDNERCKINIFITGSELKTQNLKVTSFCQVFKNEKWVSFNVDEEKNIKIENAILNKAKKLKLQ
jgi:hypothetical protein